MATVITEVPVVAADLMHATLNGQLSNLEGAASASCYFKIRRSTTPSWTITSSPATLTVPGAFSHYQSGMAVGVTYIVVAVALVGGIEYLGSEVTFVTSAGTPPAVSTGPASDISSTAAAIDGALTSLGTASPVQVYFEWGLTAAYEFTPTPSQNMAATGAFGADLLGLSPGTTYHYRAVAIGAGTVYGSDMSFTTLPASGTVAVTSLPAEVAADGIHATINGRLDSIGSAASLQCYFQVGRATGVYTYTSTPQVLTTPGLFSKLMSGLALGTAYRYRAVAYDPILLTYAYGADVFFDTPAPDVTLPVVSTGAATGIAGTAATLNGNLVDLGGAIGLFVGFQWGTAPGSYPNETAPLTLNAPQQFLVDLVGLVPGTTYYFRAVATNSAGTSYGAEGSFTTLVTAAPPVVITSDAFNILDTTARIGGSLTSLGSADSVVVSFEFGSSPGYYPSETAPQTLFGTGSFVDSMGALTPGTTYYYRAKAVGDGTTYGAEKSFTTSSVADPVVITQDALSITSNAARLSGNLTSLGDASAVDVSFEWGTAPQTYSYATASQRLSGSGTYGFDLTGLTPGTTYYYRAKAVDPATLLPVYGAEGSFTTAGDIEPPPGGDKTLLYMGAVGIAALALMAITQKGQKKPR